MKEQQEQTKPPEKSISPSGNQKLIVGLILGLLIGLLIAFYSLNYFPIISSALFNVLIALFILVAIGVFIYTWFKDWILTKIFGVDFQLDNTKKDLNNLYDTISQQYVGKLLENFPAETQNEAKLATPRLIKLGVWAFTRSWALRIVLAIFVAIGGLLGAILLYNQNELLSSQNSLILNQNKKLDTQNERLNFQNNLIEAERRSSLVFLMSNVLDKVDEEITEQRKQRDNPLDTSKYSLSKPLISRIVALSRAFRPYRIMEGDTLSNESISPERGQLFISLMENNLDSTTQNTIVEKGDFSRSVVNKINLQGSKLKLVDLSNSYFFQANFSHSDISQSDLRFSDFRGASFKDSDLTMSGFNGSNCRSSSFVGAYLGATTFHNTDLTGANFASADFSGGPSFDGAILDGANFRNVDFERVHGITVEQLLTVNSLIGAINIKDEFLNKILKEKPCLFSKRGCN